MIEINEDDYLTIRSQAILEAEEFLSMEFAGPRFALITNTLLSCFSRRLFREIGVKLNFGEEAQK
jgi:pheromone shutdown protein TraB